MNARNYLVCLFVFCIGAVFGSVTKKDVKEAQVQSIPTIDLSKSIRVYSQDNRPSYVLIPHSVISNDVGTQQQELRPHIGYVWHIILNINGYDMHIACSLSEQL